MEYFKTTRQKRKASMPQLLFLMGQIGVGKTTFAKRLKREFEFEKDETTIDISFIDLVFTLPKSESTLKAIYDGSIALTDWISFEKEIEEKYSRIIQSQFKVRSPAELKRLVILESPRYHSAFIRMMQQYCTSHAPDRIGIQDRIEKLVNKWDKHVEAMESGNNVEIHLCPKCPGETVSNIYERGRKYEINHMDKLRDLNDTIAGSMDIKSPHIEIDPTLYVFRKVLKEWINFA